MVPMVRICLHVHTLAAREAGEPVLVPLLIIVGGGRLLGRNHDGGGEINGLLFLLTDKFFSYFLCVCVLTPEGKNLIGLTHNF